MNKQVHSTDRVSTRQKFAILVAVVVAGIAGIGYWVCVLQASGGSDAEFRLWRGLPFGFGEWSDYYQFDRTGKIKVSTYKTT